MEVKEFLTEADGHLLETLMETKTTFMLVVAFSMHLVNLIMNIMDGQLGQIHKVAEVVKLFVPYLLII